MEGSRRDDLQLLLNRQARSTLSGLLTTLRGALMRGSGLTPAVLGLDASQQQFVERLPNACEGSKYKELFEYPTPGAPVGRLAAIEHARGGRAERMCWPDPEDKPVVKTTTLQDDTEAKRAAERGAREKEGNSGTGTWTWWTEASRTDNETVGAAVVCPNGYGCTVFQSYLGPRQMEVFDAELWAIGVTSDVHYVCGGITSTYSHDSGALQ